MKAIFEWLADKLVWLVMSIWGWLVSTGQGLIGSALDAWAAAIPGWDPAPLAGWLAGINYFVPLAEAVTLSMVYVGIWFGVFMYRAVKSWIPTVSGA